MTLWANRDQRYNAKEMIAAHTVNRGRARNMGQRFQTKKYKHIYREGVKVYLRGFNNVGQN